MSPRPTPSPSAGLLPLCSGLVESLSVCVSGTHGSPFLIPVPVDAPDVHRETLPLNMWAVGSYLGQMRFGIRSIRTQRQRGSILFLMASSRVFLKEIEVQMREIALA